MALCHSRVSLMLSTDINITETTYSCQFYYAQFSVGYLLIPVCNGTKYSLFTTLYPALTAYCLMTLYQFLSLYNVGNRCVNVCGLWWNVSGSETTVLGENPFPVPLFLQKSYVDCPEIELRPPQR